jgi:hypothetical protein
LIVNSDLVIIYVCNSFNSDLVVKYMYVIVSVFFKFSARSMYRFKSLCISISYQLRKLGMSQIAMYLDIDHKEVFIRQGQSQTASQFKSLFPGRGNEGHFFFLLLNLLNSK